MQTSKCGDLAQVFPRSKDRISLKSEMRPLGVVRNLLALSKAHGSNSMSYHFSPLYSSLKLTEPYLYFSAGKALPRNKIPQEFVEAIGRYHDFLIREGAPRSFSSVVPTFRKVAPEITEAIWNFANSRGIADDYMIPVFGPFDTKAVISFGFPVLTDDVDPAALKELVKESTNAHNEIVRYFGKSDRNVELSQRERSVLAWIAKGKSNNDIATILDITPSSVDTYTRRIFKKLGVNDRISASMQALKEGVLDS